MSADLMREVATLDALKIALGDHIDESDPEQILALMEETELLEAAQALVDSIDEDEALLIGLTARIDDLRRRKERIKGSIEGRKKLLLKAMSRTNQNRLKLATATVFKRAVKPGVEIVAELLLPSTFLRHPPPVPDKNAIGSALRAGEDVPGARLGEATTSLTIRR